MLILQWLLLLLALLAAAVLFDVLARQVHLPLTVVLAVIGFAASLVGRQIGLTTPLRGDAFEQTVVFLFLPVLVFEAALSLSTRAFSAISGRSWC